MYGLFRHTKILSRFSLIKPFKFNFSATGGHHDSHGDHGHGHHEVKDYHPKKFDRVSLAREVGKGEREEY